MSNHNNISTKARVVFDLDGTLVDSAPGIQHIANTVLRNENREPLSLEETVSFIGNGIQTFIKRMSAVRNLPETEHSRLFAEYNHHDAKSTFHTETYPGVVECLQLLRSEDCALGICTNKLTKACLAMLQDLDLTQYFDTIVCGDTISERKPDPKMLHLALDALPKSFDIYVGDSEVDAETAQRANVPFLLFSEGYRKTSIDQVPHTHLFSSYKDLPSLVHNLLK